jgi:hypothetical protein
MALMRSRSIVALLTVLCSAAPASAQVLSLEFKDGLVRLTAENVPVSRILSEWARVGGTQIVNGERIPGAPVTLQLVDVSERQALEVVLRGAAGYMVSGREAASSGASAFDKILVLPTTARAPAAASLPQPAPAQFPNRVDQEPIELEEADENPQQVGPPPGFPRGRIPRPNLPGGAPPPEVDDGGDDVDSENEAPVAPAPGNPFGIIPGGARPGTVTPPPQQEPNEAQPR